MDHILLIVNNCFRLQMTILVNILGDEYHVSAATKRQFLLVIID